MPNHPGRRLGQAIMAAVALQLGAGCACLNVAGRAQAGEPPAVAPETRYYAGYLEARLAIEAGLFDQALARLEELKKGPDCPPEVYQSIAYVHQLRNEPQRAEEALAEGLAVHPQSVDLLAARARLLRQTGRTEEAAQAYEAALALAPGRQGLLEELSVTLLQKLRASRNAEELNAAIRALTGVYERMLPGRRGAQRLPPLLVLTNLYMRMGEREKALASAEEAVSIRPREVRAQVALGDVHEALGNLDAAIECYRQAFLLEPGNTDVSEKLGRLLETKGGPDAKVAFYREAAAANPDNKDLQEAYIQTLINERRWHEAEPALQAMRRQWPDDLRNVLALVSIWLDQGRLDEAFAEAQRLVGQTDEMAGRIVLAVAQALADRGPARLADAEALLDRLPDAQREQFANGVDLLYAEIYRIRRDYRRALERIERVIERNPRSSMLYLQAGMLSQSLKDLDRAERYYRQAVEVAPNEAEPYNALGYFLAETDQKLDEAEQLIRKALSMSPAAGHIVDSMGWVLYKKGDYQGAVEQLEKSVELMRETPDPVIYDHLGDAYAKVGRLDDARRAWQRALELNPDDDLKAQLQTKLAR